MQKQNKKHSRVFNRLKTVNKGVGVLVVALFLAAASFSPLVRAATLQEKINALSAQNTKKQQNVDELQLQANSYQDAINKLETQIGDIQNAIAASETEQASLQQQIAEKQKEINYERKVLGEDLKAMYVDNQMTTIEMLATSKNLSDYLDKEEYRQAVQNKVQDTLDQITKLEQQLSAKKEQVDQLLQTQRDQQAKLDSDQAQKQHLLSLNQGQQVAYNNQIKSNKSKISQLEAEQAAINAASSRTVSGIGPSGGSGGNCDIGMGNGGYPMAWCNAGKDSVVTSGGFPNRECTSFAYWYFTSMEGKALSVSGDAKDWIYTSSRPVTQTPHVGDIFVHTGGPWGHTGIVAAINNGWVRTISMNDDYGGHFYNDREYPVGDLYYIH